MKTLKRTLVYVMCFLLATIFTLWMISIIKCEYLTVKYGIQFENPQLYLEDTLLTPHDHLKVLEYDNTQAVVYYVSKGEGGDIIFFEREHILSQWEFVKWETIWSKSGSASGYIWPYIR